MHRPTFRGSRFSLMPLLALGALAPAAASATLTAVPAVGGSMQDSGQNHLAYYGVVINGAGPLAGAPVDRSSGFPFRVMDVGVVPENDSAGNGNFTFEVYSDSIRDQGKPIVLTVNVSVQSALKAAPIHTVNGTLCNDTICNYYNETTRRYYGVNFRPGDRLTIGFYPSLACLDWNGASGCTGSVVTPPVAASAGATGQAQQMPLTFALQPVSNGTLETAVESFAVTLNFQVDPPSFNCPAGAELDNLYFPGDGAIQLNTYPFVMGTSPQAALAPNRAPARGVFVLARRGGDADATASFASGTNEIVTLVPMNETRKPVGGFQNTTGSGDNKYNVSFAVTDAAGLMGFPDPLGPRCELRDVQAAAVYGFLRKSSCFIATAAFRDMETPAVRLLRQFRDGVLERSSGGRAFVRWYYDWSPAAADWLLRHPLFRLPVLLALVPLQVLAWLALHPGVTAVLGFWATALLGGLLVWRLTREKGAAR